MKIELNLPEEVLTIARRKARERGISLSRFVAGLIADCTVTSSDQYAAAMERQQALMRQGLDLRFNGRVPWTREELHRRSAK